MRANIPNIYVAGDAAQTYDPILEKTVVNALWPNAVDQGMIAAANILGENKKYPGSCGMNSVEFFGLPVISFGITRPDEQQGFEELAFKDEKKDVYKKVILKITLLKEPYSLSALRISGYS